MFSGSSARIIFFSGSRDKIKCLSRQKRVIDYPCRRKISSNVNVTRPKKEEILKVSSKTSSSSHQERQASSVWGRSLSIAAVSLTIGFVAGLQYSSDSEQKSKEGSLVLPNGLPRTCCDSPDKNNDKLTDAQKALFRTFRRIVGKENVLDGQVDNTKTSQYLKGARLGYGNALCIVKPQKLLHVIQIVQEAIDADCVVLVQGQNTGLTGGSVPRNSNSKEHDDEQHENRPTVLISMTDLDTIFPIDGGNRVVCLGGAGLATLHTFVQTFFPDRESHSILGSTFLNPTVGAGVAYGSGGTQCRKGPAYTERALYLKVVPDRFGVKVVKVVNTLGITDLDDEEGEFTSHLGHKGVIRAMDAYVHSVKGHYDNRMKRSNDGRYGSAAASQVGYKKELCKHDDDQVCRYNADTSDGGCECNRSEGKVIVLASVHDTFPRPSVSKTFWLSFDSLDTALAFRRQVCLDNPNDVPVSMEYMDRDSFDVIDRSGRVLGNMIKMVGTSSALIRNMWKMKLWIEALDFPGATLFVDKLLYNINPIVPGILPRPIADLGRQMDHHVALTVGDYDGSLDRFLNRMEEFQKLQQETENKKMIVHECTTSSEQSSLTAFRFVAAPAFRTWCVGQGVQGFSVDYALPRNGGHAPSLDFSSSASTSGSEVTTATPLKRMRYSHFGCNVVHEDLAYAPGVDIEKVKYQLKHTVEHSCKGKLPAEHGHGTEYHAPEATRKRWMLMDPLNVFNPGIGGLSTKYRYKN